jgi:hypothetical protein
MGHRTRTALAAPLLGLAIIVCMVGCGGSGSQATAGVSTAVPSGPSREFMEPGGENAPAEFGHVAGEAEREAASKVLAENFKARAAAHFATQCKTLAPKALEVVEEEADLRGGAKGCAANLALVGKPLSASKEARENTLTGPIDVLRVKAPKAYALYHGKAGKDYAMPMEKVGGKWMAAALTTVEVP